MPNLEYIAVDVEVIRNVIRVPNAILACDIVHRDERALFSLVSFFLISSFFKCSYNEESHVFSIFDRSADIIDFIDHS